MENAYKTKVQKTPERTRTRVKIFFKSQDQPSSLMGKKKKEKETSFDVNENSKFSSLGTEPILWYVN